MTTSRTRLTEGTLVHSRYRIHSLIGFGGAAAVYRATDEQLGREVALKVIPHGAADSPTLRRVEDEVRLAAGFSHPALVTLFDVASDPHGDSTALVMQLVDGQDLARRLSSGAADAEETARIGSAVASALAYVHDAGVVHRDVKPANILLPSAGPQPALLADFGIARLIDSAGITSTGTVIGTASYLSPEQARGDALTGATDVYSLGLVLLEALTGQRAFPGTAVESIAARLSADPAVPATLPAAWSTLLRSMLERDPQRRPAAAEIEATLGSLEVAPTLVLPSALAATHPLPTATTTEALTAPMPTAVMPAPTRDGRPRDRRRAVVVTAVLVAAAGAIAAAVSIGATGARDAAPDSGTTSASPAAVETPASDPTTAAVSYPAVEGALGDALVTLQQAAAGVDDATDASALGERVLAITTAAAEGDYQLARDTVDALTAQVDALGLTAADRETIRGAIDDVATKLDAQLKHDGKPGKPDGSSKPGKP